MGRAVGGQEEALYILGLEERLEAASLRDDAAALLTRMETLNTAIQEHVERLSNLPAQVQHVIDNCDVVEIHRALSNNVEDDLWARLGDHTQTEALRLQAFMSRTEASVHAAVSQLRDAAAGKPALPVAPPGASAARRAVARVKRGAVRLLRACAELQPAAFILAMIAIIVASASVTVAAIAVATHGIAPLH
jgi:hypothetical protein